MSVRDGASARLALVGLDKDLLDAAGCRIVAIFDPNVRGSVCGVPVIGGDDAWADYKASNPDIHPLVAIDPPRLRRVLAVQYGEAECVSFVADDATVSAHAEIGRAVVIQRRVYVGPDVHLQEGVRINVGAQIHHDCVLGRFTTVAPGALLMGSVSVGEEVYIGAGAVVLQGLTVGAGATIGAGAVVTRAVAGGATVIGVPAKPLAPA